MSSSVNPWGPWVWAKPTRTRYARSVGTHTHTHAHTHPQTTTTITHTHTHTGTKIPERVSDRWRQAAQRGVRVGHPNRSTAEAVTACQYPHPSPPIKQQSTAKAPQPSPPRTPPSGSRSGPPVLLVLRRWWLRRRVSRRTAVRPSRRGAGRGLLCLQLGTSPVRLQEEVGPVVEAFPSAAKPWAPYDLPR